MNRRLNLGLVGTSRGSAYGTLAYRSPECDIVALCDISPEALAVQQKRLELSDSQCFTDYEKFIAETDLDGVIISTPISLHADQTVMALERGVNVLSEVTASNTIDGCRRIIEAVRRTGKMYMIGENACFSPRVKEWHALVESGRLGEIVYAEGDYIHPIPELLIDAKTGERKWRAERPPLHYCSHSLGPILLLTGDRIMRAMGIGQGHRILPEVPIGGVDMQVALFETQKGMLIKMTRTQAAPRHPAIHYCYLQGTKGFVETGRSQEDSCLVYLKDEMEQAQRVEYPHLDPEAPEWALLPYHGTSDYGTFKAFWDALSSGQKPVLDEVWAWDVTVPGLVAAESARQGGQWMDVPEPPA